MNNLPKKLSFIIFFGLLVALPIATIFSPKEKFSDVENRPLADFPKATSDNIIERKFMNGIETYLADHFVGRTAWISAKTKMELAEGKGESNGVYILKDRLIEKLDTPDYTEIDKSIAAINNFAETNKIPTYVMLAPTSTGVYADELPEISPQYDQKKFINDVYAKFSNQIISLDIFNTMFSNRDQYIYYRNDHHWTSLGAYYAYSSTIKRMGYKAISLDKFDIEHASSEFKGTLYSKAVYDEIPADTIDIYSYADGTNVTEVLVNNGSETTSYPSLYFREYLEKKDKYSTFLGSNQPIITVKTNSVNGKKLLMFKDSYAHSYVPFLAQHYSEITLVDMRYINTAYADILEVSDYDQVMFLYNAATFAGETNIKKLDF
ncbi:MAG: DHHW family protein [Oscillospiraceae bacterium]